MIFCVREWLLYKLHHLLNRLVTIYVVTLTFLAAAVDNIVTVLMAEVEINKVCVPGMNEPNNVLFTWGWLIPWEIVHGGMGGVNSVT